MSPPADGGVLDDLVGREADGVVDDGRGRRVGRAGVVRGA